MCFDAKIGKRGWFPETHPRCRRYHLNGQEPLFPMKNIPKPALSQQIAVVTGAGRGIGAAIAATLARLGAHVILCGRTLQTLEATSTGIREAHGESTVAQCDVTDLRSVE